MTTSGECCQFLDSFTNNVCIFFLYLQIGRGWEVNSLQWIFNTLFAGTGSESGSGYSGCNATRVHQWLVLGHGWDPMLKAIQGTIRRATSDAYSDEDGVHIRPHINVQSREQLRHMSGGIMCNKQLGPLLADKFAESSANYFATNIAYLRTVTESQDPGGSIQAFFRQTAALIMVQLERLEVQRSENGSESEQGLPMYEHYLGHVQGTRAKAFFDVLNIQPWSKGAGAGVLGQQCDLLLWESLAVRPARAMCVTTQSVTMMEQRVYMLELQEKHERAMPFIRGNKFTQGHAAYLAAARKGDKKAVKKNKKKKKRR